MRIELEITNTENIADITPVELNRIREIFEALVTTGSLTGVRGGQTIIHFDNVGEFQKVEVKYSPWERRRNAKKVV